MHHGLLTATCSDFEGKKSRSGNAYIKKNIDSLELKAVIASFYFDRDIVRGILAAAKTPYYDMPTHKRLHCFFNKTLSFSKAYKQR